MRFKRVKKYENIFVLVDENGRSVLDLDAVKFGLDRKRKFEMLDILSTISESLQFQGSLCLSQYIQDGILKRIEGSQKAQKYNLWEVRSSSHGGRIFFRIDEMGQVIVSAVDKQLVQKSTAQDEAINRGIKRWEALLKRLERLV